MTTQVTPANFTRAETDTYFDNIVSQGGFGRLNHIRELAPVESQFVVRPNRDTLYSVGVFDLHAGDVTITLPDPKGRFMSVMTLDEDEYTHGVHYDAGEVVLSRKEVGTRYGFVMVRILIDPTDPDDEARVHALQDAIEVKQAATGSFDIPDWDPVSRVRVHDALAKLGETISGSYEMFGAREEVDPVMHLIGTAIGWGGNPKRDALYIGETPEHNDGITAYRLVVRDVPVDGFWSISVYNAAGYFVPNVHELYSLNNLTARRRPDGSIVVQFGGEHDDPNVNWLPVVPGWNYTVRLYRPRPELLDGTWRFPKPQPITSTTASR